MARFEFVPRDDRSSKNEWNAIAMGDFKKVGRHTSHPCPAQALVARGAYAERWGLPHYLWLGAVDDGLAAPDCDARDAEVALRHVVKVLARAGKG